MTADGDQGLQREKGRITETGWIQPQKDQKSQRELDYMPCFTISPVRAGFVGCSLKH